MLRDIMETLGFDPIGDDTGKSIKYFSPFNTSEKTPSFFLLKSNSGQYDYYKDHGSGEKGGNHIEFIKKFFNLTLRGAYLKLDELTGEDTQASYKKDARVYTTTATSKGQKAVFLSEDKITHKYLTSYLLERGITTIHEQVKQVNYQVGDNVYHSIAVKNVNDGYNHRNSKVKGVLGKTGISIIGDFKKDIVVVEGLIDFLSHNQISKNESNSYLVMNSTALTNHAIKFLSDFDNHRVILALDNGTSGDVATLKIQEAIGSTIDIRKKYRNFDDLNDMLINKPKTKRELRIIKKENEYLIFKAGKKLSTHQTLKEGIKQIDILKKG